MTGNEGEGSLQGDFVQAQPAQSLFREQRADFGVAVEVAHAGLIQGEGGGLAHIVEQSRKTQHRLRRDLGKGLDAVGIDIVAVVGIALVEAHGGSKLRENLHRRLGEF